MLCFILELVRLTMLVLKYGAICPTTLRVIFGAQAASYTRWLLSSHHSQQLIWLNYIRELSRGSSTEYQIHILRIYKMSSNVCLLSIPPSAHPVKKSFKWNKFKNICPRMSNNRSSIVLITRLRRLICWAQSASPQANWKVLRINCLNQTTIDHRYQVAIVRLRSESKEGFKGIRACLLFRLIVIANNEKKFPCTISKGKKSKKKTAGLIWKGMKILRIRESITGRWVATKSTNFQLTNFELAIKYLKFLLVQGIKMGRDQCISHWIIIKEPNRFHWENEHWSIISVTIHRLREIILEKRTINQAAITCHQ